MIDNTSGPRLSVLGDRALLLDAGLRSYCATTQAKVWALAHSLEQDRQPWCLSDIVPGMNNLMVVFQPRTADCAARLQTHLLAAWGELTPQDIPGSAFDIDVEYDARPGSDLCEIAQQVGMTLQEVVQRHSQAVYRVACVGGMPGFAYLAGLDPALQRPRRTAPRTQVVRGAVIIGGEQASIMPITAPTGWHILGHTTTVVFDSGAQTPCLLRAGDTLRFRATGLLT